MNAFPPGLPASLDSQTAIEDHDWQAFRRLTHMENHWDRPGWLPGRRSYHWMLRFPDAENVRQLSERCQVQLPLVGLDMVPLDTLHLTIGRIGFTDDLVEATALSIAEEAASSCRILAAFPLTIGPLGGSAGALRFSVAPWSLLLKLHRQVTVATRAVIGARCVMDTTQFRPHLSIAYANASIPVASLIPDLERLRALSPEEVTVSSVSLVELRREGRAYRFETMKTLLLGELRS